MASLESALLHEARCKTLKGGSLTTIFVYKDIVVKMYDGPYKRGRTKLESEISYLTAIPKTCVEYFPPLIETVKKSNLIALAIPYYKSMISITAHTLGQSDISRVWDVLERALRVVDGKIHPLYQTKSTVGYLESTQFSRAESALAALKSLGKFSKLATIRRVHLNGEQLINFGELIPKLRTPLILNLIAPPKLCFFHGNFHADNILTDLTKFILIDPRGEIVGCADYDIAKMFCHLYIRYDEIHYDLFKLKKYGSNDYDVKLLDSRINARYAYLQRKFIEYELRKKRVARTWHKKMLILGSIHTLSLASYHARKENPNVSRVEAYYLCGLKLLNDYFNGSGVSKETALLPYESPSK